MNEEKRKGREWEAERGGDRQNQNGCRPDVQTRTLKYKSDRTDSVRRPTFLSRRPALSRYDPTVPRGVDILPLPVQVAHRTTVVTHSFAHGPTPGPWSDGVTGSPARRTSPEQDGGPGQDPVGVSLPHGQGRTFSVVLSPQPPLFTTRPSEKHLSTTSSLRPEGVDVPGAPDRWRDTQSLQCYWTSGPRQGPVLRDSWTDPLRYLWDPDPGPNLCLWSRSLSPEGPVTPNPPPPVTPDPDGSYDVQSDRSERHRKSARHLPTLDFGPGPTRGPGVLCLVSSLS